jgi:hypothetical protein
MTQLTVTAKQAHDTPHNVTAPDIHLYAFNKQKIAVQIFMKFWACSTPLEATPHSCLKFATIGNTYVRHAQTSGVEEKLAPHNIVIK